MDEARSLVSRGAREVVLTGVNIGTYEWRRRRLVDVVDALAEITGLERIRISSIEPTTIEDGLLARMADGNHPLTPYLHIPLQSGSDSVLRSMRRKYTRADFVDFLSFAAARVPDLGIGTDVMAGMPGERDEDFAETLSVLSETPIFYAHVFKYSERSGTASARMGGTIPPEAINARAAAIRRLSAHKRALFCQGFVGQTVDVLFEHQEDGYWSGYTPQFVRVAAPSEEDLTNVVRPVMLEAVCGDFVTGRVNDGR
jgi:threonylcarbamoyladenosine tRNA methylthiotransferase MtaB